MTFNRIDRRAW